MKDLLRVGRFGSCCIDPLNGTSLTAVRLAGLRLGEAYVWSSKATDDAFTKVP